MPILPRPRWVFGSARKFEEFLGGQRLKWVSGSWVMGQMGHVGQWVTSSDPLTYDKITVQ